jgi:hypothetical protein
MSTRFLLKYYADAVKIPSADLSSDDGAKIHGIPGPSRPSLKKTAESFFVRVRWVSGRPGSEFGWHCQPVDLCLNLLSDLGADLEKYDLAAFLADLCRHRSLVIQQLLHAAVLSSQQCPATIRAFNDHLVFE